MTNHAGLTFSVGDIIPWFTIGIELTFRIGDTKYPTQCSATYELGWLVLFATLNKSAPIGRKP